MSTLHRVSWVDDRGFVTHQWFPTLFTANDRVNELVTLGMESVDFEEVEVPWDHLADLIHWLNKTPNSPYVKDTTMEHFTASFGPITDGEIIIGFGAAAADAGRRAAGIPTKDAGPNAFEPQGGESDPNGLTAGSPGAKLDAGKTRPWLCIAGFSNALEAVAEVTTKGAAKYSDNGWTQVPDGEARYMEAFGRHLLALGRGEVFDNGPNGTGARHKAQMIWNLLASLELELRPKE